MGSPAVTEGEGGGGRESGSDKMSLVYNIESNLITMPGVEAMVDVI